ncbi:hypothetical protein OAE25_02305 [Verrucomicrobiales bacterium]|nr:hypothetical protein [Verrucomicrobiales bacterium]
METTEPDFEGWTFMGDIHRMLGNTTMAGASYKRALEYLKTSLTSDEDIVQSNQ